MQLSPTKIAGFSTAPSAARGLFALAVCLLVGCNSHEDESGTAMILRSSKFSAGQRIPKQYSGEGKDLSPPLTWKNVPAGVQEFALICDDPDAPDDQPWVHWVIYGLPGETRSLPEGLPAEVTLNEPAGAMQGVNSWPSGRTVGYRGPMPPPGHGAHHYHFKLYALKAPLALPAGADKATLLKAIEGNSLATSELIGTYER